MAKITQDRPQIMSPRQRELSFYLVFLIAIFPIYSIVPFAWIFVIYTLRTGAWTTFGWAGKASFTVAILEVCDVPWCRKSDGC